LGPAQARMVIALPSNPDKGGEKIKGGAQPCLAGGKLLLELFLVL